MWCPFDPTAESVLVQIGEKGWFGAAKGGLLGILPEFFGMVSKAKRTPANLGGSQNGGPPVVETTKHGSVSEWGIATPVLEVFQFKT